MEKALNTVLRRLKQNSGCRTVLAIIAVNLNIKGITKYVNLYMKIAPVLFKFFNYGIAESEDK